MAGIVGVDTGCGEQAQAFRIELRSERQGLFADLEASPGEHHLDHARLYGPLDDSGLLVMETAVGQVDANIDQLHLSTSCRGPASIAKNG